jgi:hypothetical protein
LHPEPGTTTLPFYVWKPAKKSISVQLPFEVVDRMLLEIMRGFGAVPKRGAEVGGILLGTAKLRGDEIVVSVESFEGVACDHASGPSFILSEDDRAGFLQAVERWQRGPDRRVYPVGYYRGHTRDGICLAAEDLAILEEFFPEPTAIAMIVKPYATKVSMAGIFFREDGQFKADASHLEFPFRRKELGGGTSGMERPTVPARFEPQRAAEPTRGRYRRAEVESGVTSRIEDSGPLPLDSNAPEPFNPVVKHKSARGSWFWIPLSIVFMLLGIVVGYQLSLIMRPKQPANPWQEAWDMTLQVKRTGDELTVTWNPLAPAVRNAGRGALIIQSREETRTIDLRGPQLQGGSVIYRGIPDRVIFRLEVYPRDRVVVSEIAEFKRE